MSKYKRDFTDDVTIEEAPTVESFDFTVDESVMPARTRLAYYRLRRAALTRNDPSALPEGKTMTLDEVESLLGFELGDAEGPRQCCV